MRSAWSPTNCWRRSWTASRARCGPTQALLEPLGAGETLRRRGAVSPDAPAYVIYTSGSTGKPKGILISQRSICHFLRSENQVLGIRADDRVYQGFSVAFDMSFEEIWIAYLVGATLWIGPKEISGDPETLPRMLAANHVTVLHAVPTLLALFSEEVASLRLINLGGEMCPESLVERWARPGREIFNTYGPTEATVSASLARLQPGRPITIGTPLPNYGLLVIGTEGPVLALLARGETGELCITGPGLAAGYLGRPDLTEEKFLANPWATRQRTTPACTAPATWRASTPTAKCSASAAPTTRSRSAASASSWAKSKRCWPSRTASARWRCCCARTTASTSWSPTSSRPPAAMPAALTGSALRHALTEHLPPYMVPGRYEMLPLMPRLTSGKIDRKALKAMPLSAPPAGAAGESDLPETPAEIALFGALAKLFPGQPIRRDADFFSDLGGHSFFAARLASALRADPAFAHVTVRDIYHHRQLGKIAAALADAPAAGAAQADWTPPSAASRWRCGAAQAAAVPFLVTCAWRNGWRRSSPTTS